MLEDWHSYICMLLIFIFFFAERLRSWCIGLRNASRCKQQHSFHIAFNHSQRLSHLRAATKSKKNKPVEAHIDNENDLKHHS